MNKPYRVLNTNTLSSTVGGISDLWTEDFTRAEEFRVYNFQMYW